MKLCIVTPAVIKGDGQGRANYEIVWEAIRRGHHVTLVTSNLAPDLQQHQQVRWVSITAKGFPTELLRQLIFSSRSANWLKAHSQEFDIVQIYGAVTSSPSHINTVQFVHSAWLRSPVHTSKLRRDYYGAYHWLYSALNSHWEKQAFQRTKVVVAVSERVKQELIDIGVPAQQIRVIYNGVDVQESAPGIVDRAQLGLPEDATVALFAGDIRTNRKNLDTVLYALAEVPNLHLAVVGSTEGSPYLSLAAKLGLTERVHFFGYRRDVPDIMRAVDLFVFPSRYEPFGMVVTEAMATGLPVITASTTGAAEVVTPECGTVLAESEDTQGLAAAMRALADDPDRRRQMGRAARAVAEQHTWSSKAGKYIYLFEEVNPL